jgi:hypothetical protein
MKYEITEIDHAIAFLRYIIPLAGDEESEMWQALLDLHKYNSYFYGTGLNLDLREGIIGIAQADNRRYKIVKKDFARDGKFYTDQIAHLVAELTRPVDPERAESSYKEFIITMEAAGLGKYVVRREDLIPRETLTLELDD